MSTEIGTRVRRKEDYRFLTGLGTYTDDIVRPGQTFAYFVRSLHAHAKIKSVDTADAMAARGVLGIFTVADLEEDKIGGLICGWTVTDRHGEPMKAPAHPALAKDRVRYVGAPTICRIFTSILRSRRAHTTRSGSKGAAKRAPSRRRPRS